MSDHNINLSFLHHPPPSCFYHLTDLISSFVWNLICWQIFFPQLERFASISTILLSALLVCLLASSPPGHPCIQTEVKRFSWVSQAWFSYSLSPYLSASNFSDLCRSEKDLLGSSLNWGNGLWSAYWSPCCVCTLSHTELTQTALQAKRCNASQELPTAYTLSWLDTENNSQQFRHFCLPV